MGLIRLGQSARQPPPGGRELSLSRPDKACVNCMGSASYAFPSPTAIFTSRNDRTRYLETPTSYPRPNWTPKPDLHVTEVLAAARNQAPHTRWRSGLPTHPHAEGPQHLRGPAHHAPTTRPPRQPRPGALTHQRRQSAEVAKHTPGSTRLKARRPSRAPHPLGLPLGGVSRGPRPGGAAACPSRPSFRSSGDGTLQNALRLLWT